MEALRGINAKSINKTSHLFSWDVLCVGLAMQASAPLSPPTRSKGMRFCIFQIL